MQHDFAHQPGNPLLQVLQLAQLAASLPAQQQPAGHYFAAPVQAQAYLPPPAPAVPASGTSPAAHQLAATSGTSSDRLVGPPAGDATAELEAHNSIAGLKLPVTCNDIRGVVYLDQQVVACYCPTCEQRVAGGHGRPLFSFTRFERHSGSKAKKWRLSIRIDPGAVKEAPPDEPPLALGQWLESKGLVSWAPRGGLKIGPSSGGGGSSEDEGSPMYGEDSAGGRRQYGAMPDRRQATIGPRPVAFAAAAPATANGFLGKRPRQEYETPDLPSHADRQQWLQSQRTNFDAVASAAAASSSDAAGGSSGGGACSSCGGSSVAVKHAAIFGLVYGLLEEGDDRRAFNEVYLPWLNELPVQRLNAEFATLHSYLGLLGGGMGWEAVRGLMTAYVKAILSKASR